MTNPPRRNRPAKGSSALSLSRKHINVCKHPRGNNSAVALVPEVWLLQNPQIVVRRLGHHYAVILLTDVRYYAEDPLVDCLKKDSGPSLEPPIFNL